MDIIEFTSHGNHYQEEQGIVTEEIGVPKDVNSESPRLNCKHSGVSSLNG